MSAAFDLTGRVAIVTGAGQGIGRALAHAYGAEGVKTVVADINGANAEQVAHEVGGNSAIGVMTDVSDEASVNALVERTLEAYGRIDILVNAAAIFSTLKMRPFWEIPVDEWRRVLDVNVTGSYLACRAVAPVMRAAGRGRIVNFGSAAVTMGRPNYTHYTTSKAAIVGMTRSMARELGPDGITVNTILPGATYTEVPRETVTPQQKEAITALQCIPRPAAPADLIGTLLFLSSDASAFMTGQSLTVDGGTTHL